MRQVEIPTVFSAEQIAARVSEIGQEIRSTSGAAEVFLLGVLKGTSCLLADLLRAVSGPVSYGYIDVVRDVADAETATALEIDFLSYIDISGRNVYLLKDVVSTGVIESYLLTQLRAHNPASLKLVALIDRPSMRTVQLDADYRLFEAPEGLYVGYGLEIEGRHANLPHIGKL